MANPTPVPTAPPSVWGLDQYAPMSSKTNPTASNYTITAPMSIPGTSRQLNAFGAPLYSSNAWNTTNRVAATNPSTGTIISTTPSNTEENNTPPTPSTSTGPSAEDQLRSEVASIFDPVFSALSGQENTLQSNYGITQGDINQQYNTSSQALASQNERGINQLNELGTEAGKTKEDALTASTRLYNELTRGGQQRFGGASSAGEAYGALTAVEQQRRQGTIQSAYDTAMAKVASYKNDLISKYQDALTQLESEKNSALATARQQFNDAWQAIQNAKNQAQSDKAAATLSSLNDYRNKVYTINMNAVNFAQTLAANKDASLKYVDNITQQVVNSLNSGSNAIATLGTQATGAANNTTYGKIGAYTAPTTTYTGQIQSQAGKKWDPITQSWIAAA